MLLNLVLEPLYFYFCHLDGYGKLSVNIANKNDIYSKLSLEHRVNDSRDEQDRTQCEKYDLEPHVFNFVALDHFGQLDAVLRVLSDTFILLDQVVGLLVLSFQLVNARLGLIGRLSQQGLRRR